MSDWNQKYLNRKHDSKNIGQQIYVLTQYKYSMTCISVFSQLYRPHLLVNVYLYMTIATGTRFSAQNEIHRTRFSMFDRLVFTFYWADSIENCGVFFSYDWDLKLNACNFFCNFFCGVISWSWFVNMVLFHIWSWNKWTELFNLDGDKIHDNGWRSGGY